MTGKPFRDGPAYIADSAADLYTSPDSALIADVTQIHLVNKSASPVVATIFVGSTGGSAGGTEVYDAEIPADSHDDVYFPGGMPISSADFISAVAASASAVVATIVGTLRAA